MTFDLSFITRIAVGDDCQIARFGNGTTGLTFLIAVRIRSTLVPRLLAGHS